MTVVPSHPVETPAKWGLFDLLGYTPYEGPQSDFHRATSWYRFVSMFMGARGGKSIADGYDTLVEMIRKPDFQVWNAGPTYDQCDKEFAYTWNAFHDVLVPQFGLKAETAIFNTDRGKLILELPNRSKVDARSCENELSLLGAEVDLLNLCEGTNISFRAWHRYLRRRLASREGRAVLPSTPAGANWAKDEFYDRAVLQAQLVAAGKMREPWYPRTCTRGHPHLVGFCKTCNGTGAPSEKPWGSWSCLRGHRVKVACAECKEPEKPVRTHWTVIAPAWDNPHFPEEERRELEQAIAEGDLDALEQGAGQFVNRAGNVLAHVQTGRNILPAASAAAWPGWKETAPGFWEPPPDWILGVGMDRGEKSPSSSEVLAIHPTAGWGVFWAEYYEAGITTADHVRETRSLLANRDPLNVTFVLDRAANHNDYRAMGMSTIESKSLPGTKKDFWSLFNRLGRKGQIFVLQEQCPNLAREIPRLRWKNQSGSDEADQVERVRKVDDHAIDGAVYILYEMQHRFETHAVDPPPTETLGAQLIRSVDEEARREADGDAWFPDGFEDAMWDALDG